MIDESADEDELFELEELAALFATNTAGLLAAMDDDDYDEDESASHRRPYRSRASTARGGTRVNGRVDIHTYSKLFSKKPRAQVNASSWWRLIEDVNVGDPASIVGRRFRSRYIYILGTVASLCEGPRSTAP